MINVGFIIASLNMGGAEQQLLTLLRNLDRGRYCVSLFVLHGGSLLPDVPADVAVRADLWRSSAGLRTDLIVRALREAEIGLVVQYGRTAAGIVGRLAAMRAEVPVIVQSVHSNVFDASQPRRWVLGQACRFLDGKTAKIVCVSHAQADALVRSGVSAGQIQIIPNGIGFAGPVEAEKARGCDTPDEFVVAAVGQFRAVKRYDVLLRALALARARGCPVRAILVGDGPELRKMRLLARELALEGVTTFTGERSDVQEVLRAADVLVSTSDSESFSIAAAEAMMCSRPVIATRSGGVEEVVVDGETGLLVPKRDAEAVVDALIALWLDNDLRRRMGDAGRIRAMTNFSVETMVKGYEDLFEELTC
jgi:L-malate glycosyltransferase